MKTRPEPAKTGEQDKERTKVGLGPNVVPIRALEID